MKNIAFLMRLVAVAIGFVLAGAVGFGQNVSISVPSNSVVGGANGGYIQVTVKLSSPAPAGGFFTVSFHSSNSNVLIPVDNAVFSPGQTTATGSVETEPVATLTNVTLTASAPSGSTSSTNIEVLPSTPLQIGNGGYPTVPDDQTLSLELFLNGPAPWTGLTVYPVSNSPLAVCGPCVITDHQTSGTFTVKIGDVRQNTPVTISAGSASLTLNVVPNSVSLSVPAPSFFAGTATTGTATLKYSVNGSFTASLASSSPAVTVPSTISFPAYSTQTTFPIAVSKTAKPGPVTITVTYEDGSSSASFVVVSTMLKGVTVAPTYIASGGVGTGTVTLSSTNPQAATVVNLSADQPFIELPATVTIPAGATSATFPVRVAAISGGDTATVTASEPGSSAFTGVMAGFNGIAPGTWSTYAGDAQNSGRSFSNNQAGNLGWSRSDIYGSLLYGPNGTLFVVTPPATGGTTFKITAVNPATGKSYWSELWPTSVASPQVVLDYGGSLLVPTTYGIALVNPSNGATKGVYDPSDGTMTYSSVLAGPSNRIYVVAQSWNGTYIGAVNIANDTFSWINPVAIGQGGAPTLGLASDYNDTIYAAAGKLYAFVGASGKTLWSASSPVAKCQYGGTPVVGHDGVVYAESDFSLPPYATGSQDFAAFSTSSGALEWHTSQKNNISTTILGWQGQVNSGFGDFQGSPSNPIGASVLLDWDLVQLNGDLICSDFEDQLGPGPDSAFVVGNYGFDGLNDTGTMPPLWQQLVPSSTGGMHTGAAMAPDGTLYVSTYGLLVQIKP